MRITIHKKHVAGERRNWFEYLLETFLCVDAAIRDAERSITLEIYAAFPTQGCGGYVATSYPLRRFACSYDTIAGSRSRRRRWPISRVDVVRGYMVLTRMKKKKKSSVASGKNRQV